MKLLESLARLALVAGVAAVVAGCMQATTSEPKPIPTALAAADISQRLNNNSLYRNGWRGLASWEYASHHAADGTMTARAWWFGGKDEARGRWQVTSDGLYCRRWTNHWANGEEGCFRVFSASNDGSLVFDYVSGAAGDSKQYSYQVLVGNPYSL